MGIKLIHKNNEALGSVIRNANRYTDCFMIDCGSPENALALADAIEKEAYGHPLGSAKDDAGRHFLGGEIVQSWPVGRYFTACVDPCDKAVKWCEDWLRNSGNAAPGIQGNSAGLESNGNEALSPALQQRAKLKDLAKYLETLYFFNDVYGETLDTMKKYGILYNVGASKEDNVNVAKEITADFADYCNWEVRYDKDDDVWYMAITFKPELWELGLEDLKGVFGRLNDAFMPYC